MICTQATCKRRMTGQQEAPPAASRTAAPLFWARGAEAALLSGDRSAQCTVLSDVAPPSGLGGARVWQCMMPAAVTGGENLQTLSALMDAAACPPSESLLPLDRLLAPLPSTVAAGLAGPAAGHPHQERVPAPVLPPPPSSPSERVSPASLPRWRPFLLLRASSLDLRVGRGRPVDLLRTWP